jgi:hypothetical protein
MIILPEDVLTQAPVFESFYFSIFYVFLRLVIQRSEHVRLLDNLFSNNSKHS